MPLFDPETGKLIDRNALKSVQFGNVYHGGYSHSTGTYVESVRDMGEQLKVRADEMSERMGFECKYEIADRADRETLGVSPQGAIEEHSAEAIRKRKERAAKAAETPSTELVPE